MLLTSQILLKTIGNSTIPEAWETDLKQFSVLYTTIVQYTDEKEWWIGGERERQQTYPSQ